MFDNLKFCHFTEKSASSQLKLIQLFRAITAEPSMSEFY